MSPPDSPPSVVRQRMAKESSAIESESKYFETRLAADPRRTAIWRDITKWLARYIDAGSNVLELGAGWCDFSNNVLAASVTAMDIDTVVERSVAAGVTSVVGDCTNLDRFDDGTFDVVFASNLLEHLNRSQSDSLLAGVLRVLRPNGTLLLLQPNFRLNPKRYFDDYTHVSIFTDQSLQDYLVASGYDITAMYPRFLPLTLKSRGSKLSFLVPYYLRSPIKPLAGQMLAVAAKPVRREV